MKNSTFQIITGAVLIVAVGVGFLALRALRDPSAYLVRTTDDTIGAMRNPQSGDLDTNLPEDEVPVSSDEQVTTPADEPETPAAPAVDSLEAKLTAAKATGAIYKVGSKGEAVTAIQEFLNKYEKKTIKADGDYGEGTATRIKAYQKVNGLPVTGQTAEKTLTKMIEWAGKN